jgi:hypothetical protein
LLKNSSARTNLRSAITHLTNAIRVRCQHHKEPARPVTTLLAASIEMLVEIGILADKAA